MAQEINFAAQENKSAIKGLGRDQKTALRSLMDHSGWYAGCGWYMKNRGQTISVMDSLVRRGLATRQPIARLRPGSQYTQPPEMNQYKLTDIGREALFSFSTYHRLLFAAKSRAGSGDKGD